MKLPQGAREVERVTLEKAGYPDRLLVLWMVRPEENPTGYDPEDPYTCPDHTRGSFYSGPTRVSLVDAKTGALLNTLEVRDPHDSSSDSLDVPYAIRKGFYYHVPGDPKASEEAKPVLLDLKDVNGDGKAAEFVLFDALNCMVLRTTLIGYSPAKDKVVNYPVRLKTTFDGKPDTLVTRWPDHLFHEKPERPGHWVYAVDYRGRGGSLDRYEVRYVPEKEEFEGTLVQMP
ncbi:MAG: hypothetical protein KA419_02315 [Acidobacteria bacterium]|nr:hypothetical protein [Acidobacteriota bacterium]